MSNLNYGVVGNCRTAALISEKGSIDWLCFPDFDSPSIFASLLDRERGGSFGFDVTEDYHISQSYVPHTNILSTSFSSKEGEFVVLDYMPYYRSCSGWKRGNDRPGCCKRTGGLCHCPWCELFRYVSDVCTRME